MSVEFIGRLKELLKNHKVDGINCNFLDIAKLVSCNKEEGSYKLTIELALPLTDSLRDQVTLDVSSYWNQLDSGFVLEVDFIVKVMPRGQASAKPSLANVRNVVVVASGKGGVGKSTTSVNLACSLAAMGASVGLLDADIYGPNQPLMLGAGSYSVNGEDGLNPYLAHGVYSMSMGYLIDEDTPMVWRGPMVGKAIGQLLKQTNWPELDYLIVDLPPGTGDVQLTLSSIVRLTGAVIVTTPQDVALQDANKAIGMFEKVKIPILGVIENMSMHTCSSCGHEEHIFGKDGAQSLADKYSCKVLGGLPLSVDIRRSADSGVPIVCGDNEKLAAMYHSIASQLAFQVLAQPRNYDGHFQGVS
jgi:ATP-binding protein involved in chromosome partitioning